MPKKRVYKNLKKIFLAEALGTTALQPGQHLKSI
jgi:hypothetical protein